MVMILLMDLCKTAILPSAWREKLRYLWRVLVVAYRGAEIGEWDLLIIVDLVRLILAPD